MPSPTVSEISDMIRDVSDSWEDTQPGSEEYIAWRILLIRDALGCSLLEAFQLCRDAYRYRLWREKYAR